MIKLSSLIAATATAAVAAAGCSAHVEHETVSREALTRAPTCAAADAVVNSGADATAALQSCVDATPVGGELALRAGTYTMAGQLRLARAITVRTSGKEADPACVPESTDCAILKAAPSLATRFGPFIASAPGVTVDHVIIDGNREARLSGPAAAGCTSAVNGDNSLGTNGALACSNCAFSASTSMNALCGTGLVVLGTTAQVTVRDSTFANNGSHVMQSLWSDGLTVHDSSGSQFVNNQFIDNTDVDLIFGGCPSCVITGNRIVHTAKPDGGAFVAMMIQKWPETSGNYGNVLVSNNLVDCGPNQACGSGIYVGSESWYPGTPFGSPTPGTANGRISDNTIRNAMNGLYIAAQGLIISRNSVINTLGVPIPNSCHRPMMSATPYVVSPTAASIHFEGENVDPNMAIHFSIDDWSGCIPNYPL